MGHQEPRNEVGFLIPAVRLVRFVAGTFWFNKNASTQSVPLP